MPVNSTNHLLNRLRSLCKKCPERKRSRLRSAPQAEVMENRVLLAATVFYDGFESGILRVANWSVREAAVMLEGQSPTNTNASPNKAIGSYAANLNGYYRPTPPNTPYNDLVTKTLNLNGYSSAQLTLRVQMGGTGNTPEAGDDNLRIEYRRSSGSWSLLPGGNLSAASYSSTSFSALSIALPSAAIHSNSAIRFNAAASDSRTFLGNRRESDNWFVDEVKIVANRRPNVSIAGASGTRTDGELPLAFNWSSYDPDGDSYTVSSTVTKDAVSIPGLSSTARSGSVEIDGTDGLGVYRIAVSASDGSASHAPSRSFTLVDDDAIAPVITTGGTSGTVDAAATQEFTWSIDDVSGSTSRVAVTRNGTEIFSREYIDNVVADAFNFDSYGIGSYELTITATDNDNDRNNDSLTSTATQLVNVLNSAPVAALGVVTIPGERKEGEEIEFSAAASSDPDGDALTYVWNFGDGTLVRGENVTHVFPDDGDYDVTLTVVDPFGGISEATETLAVNNVPPTVTVVPGGLPTEAAEYSIEVTLIDPGEDATSATIDWGDGTQTVVSSSGGYSHVYAIGGTQQPFRVLLEDEDGIYGVAFSQTLDIQDAAPIVTGLQLLYTGEPGQAIMFSSQVIDGVGDTFHYEWSFGDGESVSGSDQQTVNHAFTAAGLYDVRLVVTDSDGLTTEVNTTAAIGAPVSFTAAQQNADESDGILTFDVQLDNGVALASPVTIPVLVSGNVSADDYEVGAVTIEAGELTGSGTFTINDDLLNEDSETAILTLGAVAGISQGSIAQQAIVISDNDALPSVYLLTPSGTIAESNRPVSIVVALSEVSGRDVHIPIEFSGSATAGVDYVASSGAELVIPAGAISAEFEFELLDDTEIEVAENLLLSLGTPIGAVLSTQLGQPVSATVTIPQNDAPEITLDSAYRIVSEDVSEINLRARLSRISDEPISVPYSVSGTAANGDDFYIVNGSLLFLPGSLEAELRANITDDLIDEQIEYFVVEFSAPSNALLGVSSSTLTDILDNDVAEVSFDTDSSSVFEGSVLHFNVELSLPVSEAVTVSLTAAGSAIEGEDYVLSATTLTFLPGQTSLPVRIEFTDDFINEFTESLVLEFDSLTNVRLGNVNAKRITISDDDPLVGIGQLDRSVSESDGAFEYLVTLSAPTDVALLLPISYSGTARRGSDFNAPAQIVVPAGQTRVTVSGSVVDDLIVESNETFYIGFGRVAPGLNAETRSIQLTVADNDEKPFVSWAQGAYVVTESAGLLTYNLNLTHASPQATTVNLRYVSTGARDGQDFESSASRVVVPAGQTSAELTVRILDDLIKESGESYQVEIRSVSSNARLALSPELLLGRTVILDDDKLTAAELDQVTNSAFFGGTTLEWAKKFTEIIEVKPTKESPFSGNDSGLIVDTIISAVDQAADFLPFPTNLIGDIPAKTLKYLRDEYPSDDGAIDSGRVSNDFKNNPTAFISRLLTRVTAAVGIDFLTRYFGFSPDGLGDALQGVSIDALLSGIQNNSIQVGGVFEGWSVEKTFGKDVSVSSVGKKVTKFFGGGLAAGSTVFFDVDFNGIRSLHEPQGITSSDGRTIIFGVDQYDVNDNGFVDVNEGQWVAFGGTDTSVNKPFRLRFSSPANYVSTTPSSTVVAKLLQVGEFSQDNDGVLAAGQRYLDAIGVRNLNVPDFNFIVAGGIGDVNAAELFSRETQLYNMIVGVAGLFAGQTDTMTFADLGDIVFTDVAEKIAAVDSAIDSTRALVVRNIINGVSVRTGIAIDETLATAVAQIIADANLATDQIPVEGTPEFLEGVVRYQKLVQHMFLDDLQAHLDGQMSVEDLASRYSSEAIATAAAQAEIGNVLPVYLTVSDAIIQEGDSGETSISFFVTPVGSGSNLPISVNYRTDSLTAEAGVDYFGEAGRLDWLPGDLTQKEITISVLGDTVSEDDEFFSLLLENAANATIAVGVGKGTILNDDQRLINTDNDSTQQVLIAARESGTSVSVDGNVAFDGQMSLGSAIALVGDGSDQIFLSSLGFNNVLSVNKFDGSHTLSLGTSRFEIVGFQPLFDLPQIENVQRNIGLGVNSSVIAAIPDLFSGDETTVNWDLTFDGTSVASDEGDAFDFSSTEFGIHTLELTVDSAGRTVIVQQEIFIGNTSPVAVNDLLFVDEDSAITIDVLADNGNGADRDAEGNISAALTANLTSPATGVLTNRNDGTFTFDPNGKFESLAANESTQVTFDYQIQDSFGESDSATVSITINGMNDDPTVDGAVTGGSTEDDASFSVDLLAGAGDVDLSDTLDVDSLTLTSGDVSGVLPGTNELTVNPAAYSHLAVGESEVISYSYNVVDGKGGSVAQTATITIAGLNDGPTVGVPVSAAATEDDALFEIDLLAGASDVDLSDVLNVDGVTLTTGDASGVTIGTNELAVDPSAYNHLAAGESEVIVYSYDVVDGNGGSVAQTATLTISGANDGPTVNGPVSAVASEDDATFSVDLLAGASDADLSDVLNVNGLTLTSGDDSGLTVAGNALTVDPAAYNHLAVGESEVIVYSYNVVDGIGGSVAQTAAVTITGANDGPTVGDSVAATVSEDDAAFTVDLLIGVSDVDLSDVLNADGVILTSGDSSGVVVDTNELTVDPSAYNHLAVGESEVIVYSYTVVDGNGGTVAQTATIAISGVNDDPGIDSLVSSHDSVTNSSPDGNVNLSGIVRDLDASDALTITIDWGDGSAAQTIGVDRLTDAFDVAHQYAGAGVFEVTVTVSDNHGSSAQQTNTAVVQGAGSVGDTLYFIGSDQRDKLWVDETWVYDGSGWWWNPNNWDRRIVASGTIDGAWFYEVIDPATVDSLSIYTLDGNDRVIVSHDVDLPVSVASGADNDFVWIGSGNASVHAGAGDDVVWTGAGNDFVDGGAGHDEIWTDGGDDTIVDMNGNNFIVSGDGSDTITTGAGDDVIWSEGGSDVINAGDGNNSINAGGGSDQVTTGSGDDFVELGGGDDVALLGAGNDTAYGGAGNDALIGEAGDDDLRGGRGNDLLIGGVGGDQLRGGKDDDLLIAGRTIFDNDVTAIDAIMSEWSRDAAYADRIINLRNGTGSHLNGVALVVGSTVIKDEDADVLRGQNGQDWFFASLNNDQIRDRRDDEEVEWWNI